MRIKPGIYKISDSGVFTWIIDDTDSPTRELDLLIKLTLCFKYSNFQRVTCQFLHYFSKYIPFYVPSLNQLGLRLDPTGPSGPDWTGQTRLDRVDPIEPLEMDRICRNGPFELGFYGKVTCIF